MNNASNDKKVISAANLAAVPPLRLVFAVSSSFVDLSKTYATLPSVINLIVANRYKQDGIRLRVEKKEIKPDMVAMQFEGDLDFRLEITETGLGAQFIAPKTAGFAIQLLKDLAQGTLGFLQEQNALPIQNVETLIMDIGHKYLLQDPTRKNKHLCNDRLIPGLASGQGIFCSLVPSADTLGRVDVSVAGLLRPGRRFFAKVECPGNDDYSTVWPSFRYQIEDDTFPGEVTDLAEFALTFIGEAYDVFSGPYAQFLEKLLAGEAVKLN